MKLWNLLYVIPDAWAFQVMFDTSSFFVHAADLHVFTSESYLGHRGGADKNLSHVCPTSYPIVLKLDNVRTNVWVILLSRFFDH